MSILPAVFANRRARDHGNSDPGIAASLAAVTCAVFTFTNLAVCIRGTGQLGICVDVRTCNRSRRPVTSEEDDEEERATGVKSSINDNKLS
ncbi:hypothetical protein AAFF_G00114010 [Aldrovandia affinis]|uniref:Uncharacterized protein n=1 Tax=Aldrovandia affinis TaxID=143900 RepID=A0AAD7RT60_9TELE|nr:hypothetical protein AAFF_G00114010 [Aldrovandia affinis]